MAFSAHVISEGSMPPLLGTAPAKKRQKVPPVTGIGLGLTAWMSRWSGGPRLRVKAGNIASGSINDPKGAPTAVLRTTLPCWRTVGTEAANSWPYTPRLGAARRALAALGIG